MKLLHHGIDIGAEERLTNIRYADDLLLYAQSCGFLVYMIDVLAVELACVGVTLAPAKTKIVTTFHMFDACHVEVGGSSVEVLHGKNEQDDLGRLVPGDLKRRSETELTGLNFTSIHMC